jgi:tetratricopeptide (TPR) repeat protein
VTTVVAVVPFGARASGTNGDARTAKRAGVWARQIARRLVERFAGDPGLDLRPVFLVAMPDTATEAGYLVMGSTPDPKLAAEYARSLDAAYVITGTYREGSGVRRVEAALVDVAAERATASFDRAVEAGELHLTEPALAEWLARAVGARTEADLSTPALANEAAYAALLEGMDAEVDATLVRAGDAEAAGSAVAVAARAYAEAARADPTSPLPEERLLVLGATSIERDEQAAVLDGLEALAEARPRSWRANYILGEVRRTTGDVNGAIVAFEHADALQPLRDADVLTLARLYVMAGAGATAGARLRRLIQGSGDLEIVASARRLRLSVQQPELERVLEEAGRLAVEGDAARAGEAEAGFARVLAAEPEIWEAHFGRGLLARQRGDEQAAAASFRRARELNPATSSLLAELEASDAED